MLTFQVSHKNASSLLRKLVKRMTIWNLPKSSQFVQKIKITVASKLQTSLRGGGYNRKRHRVRQGEDEGEGERGDDKEIQRHGIEIARPGNGSIALSIWQTELL